METTSRYFLTFGGTGFGVSAAQRSTLGPDLRIPIQMDLSSQIRFLLPALAKAGDAAHSGLSPDPSLKLSSIEALRSLETILSSISNRHDTLASAPGNMVPAATTDGLSAAMEEPLLETISSELMPMLWQVVGNVPLMLEHGWSEVESLALSCVELTSLWVSGRPSVTAMLSKGQADSHTSPHMTRNNFSSSFQTLILGGSCRACRQICWLPQPFLPLMPKANKNLGAGKKRRRPTGLEVVIKWDCGLRMTRRALCVPGPWVGYVLGQWW
jgi:hypothetical protein